MMLQRAAVAVLFLSLVSFSEAQEAVSISHYIFPDFVNGIVREKNGNIDSARLNYNALSKEMIFESRPGQYLAIADPAGIDTVEILGRKFVFVNKEFYEWLLGSPVPLLVQYVCSVKEPGVDLGYGISSSAAASPAVKSLIKSGGAYSLHLPDGFEVMVHSEYWVLADGKYQKANSAKQLSAALPAKKEKINEWTGSHHTNFSKPADLVALISHL